MRQIKCFLVVVSALFAGCTFSPNPLQAEQVFVYNSTPMPVNATVALLSGMTEVFNQTLSVSPNTSESTNIALDSGDYEARVLLEDGRQTAANVTLSAGGQTIAVHVTAEGVSVSLLHGD